MNDVYQMFLQREKIDRLLEEGVKMTKIVNYETLCKAVKGISKYFFDFLFDYVPIINGICIRSIIISTFNE